VGFLNQSSLISDQIVVSVCIQTYQHANFIHQCLNSILNQKTNFLFEIILGEDESTDGTREICMKYANKYREKVRLFLRSRYDVIVINGKPTGRFNLMENLKASRGKYIALCEGDDYWTDEYKLQKQVDFLEANPEYFICHHGFKVLNEKGELSSSADQQELPLEYDLEVLSKRNTIGTLSVVYRNEFTLPDWFSSLNYGDYPMHLLNARHGKIKFFPEEMAVYRRHPQSATGDFKSIESPLYLLQPLEILFKFFADDKIVSKNLGLQILKLYVAVFYHYYSLKDDLKSSLYFDKIRGLKNLFDEDDLNKELLIQIYLYKIKDLTQSNGSKALTSIINDFQDGTLKYLLQEYAREVSLNRKLIGSKSYRIGNRLISPLVHVFRYLKPLVKNN
jgi:glycosyltransferase involved in cell wall biosynthesis